MRRTLPLLVVAILACGAIFFLVTARYLGRAMLAGVAEPDAFEGPELAGGYILYRSMRGPQSYIEDRTNSIVMPPRGLSIDRVGVTRIAVAGPVILGEVADLDTGESHGFFIIDTAARTVSPLSPQHLWVQQVDALLHAEPPQLVPAETFLGP
jgi:hypothetical protein